MANRTDDDFINRLKQVHDRYDQYFIDIYKQLERFAESAYWNKRAPLHLIPIGSIIAFPDHGHDKKYDHMIPENAMFCDGATLEYDSYPILGNMISEETSLGPDSIPLPDSGMFRIPDLRNRYLKGYDPRETRPGYHGWEVPRLEGTIGKIFSYDDVGSTTVNNTTTPNMFRVSGYQTGNLDYSNNPDYRDNVKTIDFNNEWALGQERTAYNTNDVDRMSVSFYIGVDYSHAEQGRENNL